MSSRPPAPARFRFHRAPALLAATLSLILGASRASASTAGSTKPMPAPKVTVASVEQKLVTEYEEITGRVDALETLEQSAHR